jgi:hypothetical protein
LEWNDVDDLQHIVWQQDENIRHGTGAVAAGVVGPLDGMKK